MNSNGPSEKTPPIELRVPTTAEDIRIMRSLREAARPWPLAALNGLAPSPLFPVKPRRIIAPAHEPFRL